MQEISTAKISEFIGLEVDGIDLYRYANSLNTSELEDYLANYHLLICRKQKLTEVALTKVAKIFGEPVPSLLPNFRLKDHPVISEFSNKKGEDNSSLGAMAPEYVFHSDSYLTTNPSKATLLYSLQSPDYGGETYFVNMCLAYDTLENEIKEFIENRKVLYKNIYINQPPLSHPLVRVHPMTKRKALFVNKHRAIGVEGLEQEKALEFLEKLYNHATQSSHTYKHKWEDGDLAIWNNPTTMHCATMIDSSQERLLYRILTKGDLPVT